MRKLYFNYNLNANLIMVIKNNNNINWSLNLMDKFII